MSRLEIDELTVRYGGTVAVDAVSMVVTAGRLTGLIGPNGAGKTSLIDAVGGFTASRGRVTLGDRRLDRMAPHRRARLGLGRTWQLGELFEDLTVRENLAVAAVRPRWTTTLRELLRARAEVPPEVDELLERLGIADLAGRSAAALTEGQRKLVGVARALASSPSIVLLDEPAAGLDSIESAALGRALRAVVDSGTGVLLVDHDMGLVMSVCDEVVVLDFGRVIARGTPAEVRNDPAVIEAYLGTAAGREP